MKQCTSATISKLFVLCRDIADNQEPIPERLKSNFFGARLVPISKKGGGIRTIAVGTIFHKLISSSLMNHIKGRLPWYFSPVQFGVGASGGAENIVHK